MSLAALVCLIATQSGTGNIQAWEKSIAPGLSYRMEYDPAGPLLIHIFRYTPTSPLVRARPELGGGMVYKDDEVKGRQTLSELVKAQGAIGGINADFFPFTGDPLGLMVRDGQLLSEPNPKRPAVAWGTGPVAFGTGSMKAKMTPVGSDPLVIDGLNEECPENALVLNTSSAGLALSKKPCLVAVLRVSNPVWSPDGVVDATLEYALPDGAPLPVQEDQVLLVARGAKIAGLAAIKPGTAVRIELSTSPFDWETMDQAIGGGPQLVKDGKRAVTATEEGFNAAFTTSKHPRTAVGRTAEGDMLFVAVDGRQKVSAGLTLDETANLMLRLGCVDAINLDGGGSTTFNLLGQTLNRPSDGKERPVANAVLFFGPYAEAPNGLTLSGPTAVTLGSTAEFKVKVAGEVVPDRKVYWASTGSAWIDQAGNIQPIETGTGQVFARYGETTLTASFEVKLAPPPAPVKVVKKPTGTRRTARKASAKKVTSTKSPVVKTATKRPPTRPPAPDVDVRVSKVKKETKPKKG